MTLLVLDLHIPTAAQVHGEGALLAALCAMGPQLLTHWMSFLTLGIFWGFCSLLPLLPRLLAEFITYRTALLLYWLNILAMGAMLCWSWAHATHAGLIKDDTPVEVRASICRRILIAQSFYAGGAALCVINTWVGIGGDCAGATELCAGAAGVVAEEGVTAYLRRARQNELTPK
jgi:uncharacterized membrane protein